MPNINANYEFDATQT